MASSKLPRLTSPNRGRVLIDGTDIAPLRAAGLGELRAKFGMLFQGGALFDSMTVEENVSFPLREHTRLSPREILEKVREKLHLVGLDGIVIDGAGIIADMRQLLTRSAEGLEASHA